MKNLKGLMKMRKYLGNKKGMTFIELVIAAGLLAVSAQGLMMSVQLIGGMLLRYEAEDAFGRQVAGVAKQYSAMYSQMQRDSATIDSEVLVDDLDNEGNPVVDPNTGQVAQVNLNFCAAKLRILPIAISTLGVMRDKASCGAECEGSNFGSMGMCIVSHPTTPKLSRMLVITELPEAAGGGRRRYEFLVGGI